MTVIDEIDAERERQKTVEGWTAEHDDKHSFGEMAMAAAVYAMKPNARSFFADSYTGDTIRDRLWPWSKAWWKPTTRRRDLVKAGALIVAEIERLDRRDTLSPQERTDG